MRRFALALLVFAYTSAAWAVLTFPQLTGRVVDDAHLLSPATQQLLETQLAAHEQATTNQIVVVTVPSLHGVTIEEYGYQLGRHWGIGQKGKNNGVLLIVAPKDRKVRIEVGYGLEGTLTDAVSSQIIQTIILPNFKKGEMEKGMVDGARAIEVVLGGNTVVQQNLKSSVTNDDAIIFGFLFFMFLMFTGFSPCLAMVAIILGVFGRNGLRERMIASAIIPALWWLLGSPLLSKKYGDAGGFSGGDGSSSSGFDGGGGDFGGGGSSGDY